MLKQLSRWRYQLDPYIQNLALDLGMLSGQREYQRFIILGRSRSGSNFLRGLLNSHSQIVVLGELFRNPSTIRWGYPGYLNTKRVRDLYLTDPVRFVETMVFKKFPLWISAVGFKIFYYHAQNDGQLPVWGYLKDQKTLKVIHIKRRNILRTHLSRKLAAESNVWVSTDGSQQDHRSIQLDHDECLQDFNQTRQWEETYDSFFSDHPMVDIFYEDLARDYSGVVERVQTFLEVKVEELKPQTFKQSSVSLDGLISNFEELKASFAGSVWESFFEDPS